MVTTHVKKYKFSFHYKSMPQGRLLLKSLLFLCFLISLLLLPFLFNCDSKDYILAIAFLLKILLD